MFFIAQLHKVQKAMITFPLFVCRLLYIKLAHSVYIIQECK
jgi:hypothetical protein